MSQSVKLYFIRFDIMKIQEMYGCVTSRSRLTAMIPFSRPLSVCSKNFCGQKIQEKNIPLVKSVWWEGSKGQLHVKNVVDTRLHVFQPVITPARLIGVNSETPASLIVDISPLTPFY